MHITNDTIAAPATHDGGALSVIRLSGSDAVTIAEKIFSRPLDRNKTLIYGQIKDADGNIIDTCVAAKMLAPASYTGEDTVEFYCHGGKTVKEWVMRELILNGARPAEKGEFTKRAFLNGKIDLTQAESVIDTINAQTKKSLLMAQKNLDGKLRQKISGLREKILNVIMEIMAENDFSEEISEKSDSVSDKIGENAIGALKKIIAETRSLIETFTSGKIINDGVTCAIIGKPNAGKSSLLNAILDEDRAIVTPLPGTTRDIITEKFLAGDFVINIADTAGIRESGDIIEQAGIEKTRLLSQSADFKIITIDLTTELCEQEKEWLETAENDIIALNKSDIVPPSDEILKIISEGKKTYLAVSAKNKTGISELIGLIAQTAEEKTALTNEDGIIFRERHFNALNSAGTALENAVSALKNGLPPDIASIDLETAAALMGEITGQTVNEEVIENIFKNFCIGK